MLSSQRALRDLPALRDLIDGEVVTPADDRWDEARRPWNFARDQRPELVAFPESAEDVVAIVQYASRNGLRVAPQGTGHNAGPLGSLDGTILLSTSRMRGVSVDAEARSARVAAGTLWLEVTEVSSELGLAPLSGSSPDVGVVGYALGGGVGWLGRKHGLAANSILAIELVTADGRLRRVDADNDPELFWALRAGPDSGSTLLMAEIRHFGGALGRVAPGHGALGKLDGDYVLFGGGPAFSPEMVAGLQAELPRFKAALAEWDAGSGYLNLEESATDSRSFYDEVTHRRLSRIKARYDAGDLFRSNHPIEPAR